MFSLVHVWVFLWVHFFPPQIKNLYVRFIDYAKLSPGVSESVNGYLSRLSPCVAVIDWKP